MLTVRSYVLKDIEVEITKDDVRVMVLAVIVLAVREYGRVEASLNQYPGCPAYNCK